MCCIGELIKYEAAKALIKTIIIFTGEFDLTLQDAPNSVIDSLAASKTHTQSKYWRDAMTALEELYGKDDIEWLAPQISKILAKNILSRKIELKLLDEKRSQTPLWYAQKGRPAYCCYIDKFGQDFDGALQHLDYLENLNVGLLHTLPLLKPREGDSDGGFAIADFFDTDPKLGNIIKFENLANELHKRDIGLIIDIVCNHTAMENEWAQRWLKGDPEFADFYYAFDKSEVDAYEAGLIDVFPDTAPGSFSYNEEIGKYIWTTFYPFQWDLNYKNPKVFIKMLEALLFLTNKGVDGFRLDSAPFLWKTKGTLCRNHKNTHKIIIAWRNLLKILSPSSFLLAEAIESISEVIPFFGSKDAPECDLAYNNVLMTALWAGIADGNGQIVEKALSKASLKPANAKWLNYIRCHDDIIWIALKDIATNEDMQRWADFYNNSQGFATAMAFQAPENMPKSSCGMASGLCGIGKDDYGLERLKLLNAIIYVTEGVPMIYMGDEIGLGNDYSFLENDETKAEIRWLHRPKMDWDLAADHNKIIVFFQQFGKLVKENIPSHNADYIKAETIEDGKALKITQGFGKGEIVLIANFTCEEINLPQTTNLTQLYGDKEKLSAYGVNLYRGTIA